MNKWIWGLLVVGGGAAVALWYYESVKKEERIKAQLADASRKQACMAAGQAAMSQAIASGQPQHEAMMQMQIATTACAQGLVAR